MKSKPKLDTEKFRDPETRRNFQFLTSNLLSNEPTSLSMNIENKWKEIKETVRPLKSLKKKFENQRTHGSMTCARMQSKKEAKTEVKLYRIQH